MSLPGNLSGLDGYCCLYFRAVVRTLWLQISTGRKGFGTVPVITEDNCPGDQDKAVLKGLCSERVEPYFQVISGSEEVEEVRVNQKTENNSF